MLLTLEEAKKVRWLKRKNTGPKDKFEYQFEYVSDGSETTEDIKYMLNWADTWSEIEGYQIVDNYNELKKAMK